MRQGQMGWVLSLAGLPLSSFLFRPHLDLWHAQALWMQGWIVALWCWSLWSGALRPVQNRPLAFVSGWVAWCVFVPWFTIQDKTEQLPLFLLQPAWHWMLLLLVYVMASSQWTKETLEQLACWIGRVGLILLAYGTLQVMGLDEFLRDSTTGAMHHSVVGTLGNPSHFGAYLAMLLPVFAWRGGWWWLAIPWTLGLIALTGSASAALIAWLAGCTWLAYGHWKLSVLLVCCGIAGGLLLWFWHPTFFDWNHRLEAWRAFWALGHRKLITGLGPGWTFEYSKANTVEHLLNPVLFRWRHMHNEYLQLLIEYGVIGVSGYAWLLAEVWRKLLRLPRTALTGLLAAWLVSTLALALVSYPWHLWMLGAFGLIAYCGVYALSRPMGGVPAWQI